MARPAEGMPRPAYVPGVVVEPHRNDWAEDFARAEAAAMSGLAVYAEMGAPTGYETGAGQGAFAVARRGEHIVGFCQATLPTGWITWLGVVPDERRRGVASLLLADLARAVLGARGTHLAAEVEAGSDGPALLAARGFRERGRRVLLIRRA